MTNENGASSLRRANKPGDGSIPRRGGGASGLSGKAPTTPVVRSDPGDKSESDASRPWLFQGARTRGRKSSSLRTLARAGALITQLKRERLRLGLSLGDVAR